jgi:hypothetical protein
MVLTLSWKEFREQWPIWITMVIAGLGLGLILSAINAGRDGISLAALAILGMAATYGVVCGSMMLAGEREAGTMVFLDIFLGRRDLIWLWKFLIGIVLALTQALVVAAVLVYVQQAPPEWLPLFVGLGKMDQAGFMAWNLPRPNQGMWFLVLPVVTMEAYAWGLLGSSLSRRVVNGAACAALMAAPLLLLVMCTPPPLFLAIRLMAAIIALVVSGSVFLNQSRETQQGPPPRPEEIGSTTLRGGWGEMDRPRRRKRPLSVILVDQPTSIPRAPIVLEEAPEPLPYATIVDDVPEAPAAVPIPAPAIVNNVPKTPAPATATVPRKARYQDAESSLQVLLWLTFNQAWIMFGIMAGVAFVVGFFVPAQGQVLWPVVTLLLGVSCGTAAFAQEQSDLSYQFLAAQHFPLKTFWNMKIAFWFIAALAGVLLALASSWFVILLSAGNRPGAGPFPDRFHFGTLKETMGPLLFFGVWLVYGFCIAQVFVLLCRKSILAALLSGLVTAGALGLWLPTVLCGGINGWQVWLPPLAMLLATRSLMRAWAAGRIKERRPSAALIGIGLVCLAWAGLVFNRRAWEIPDVGEPMDRLAFSKSIPQGKDNKAGPKIEEALGEFQKDERGGPWIKLLAETTRLPVGVIVAPTGDGQESLLRHLPGCEKMALRLHQLVQGKLEAGSPEEAFDHLAQILALSRNLRNKAPLASYLVGIRMEDKAIEDLLWRIKDKRPAKSIQHVLDELNRHAAETSPPVDCLNTECFRAGGALANPATWTFFSGKDPERVPERWLAGGIAFSLDVPWEQERTARMWRTVWAGLYRNLQTPHWQLPDPLDGGKTIRAEKEASRQILQSWLPPTDGPAASWTIDRLASTLDQSWLADEKLFCSVKPLRLAGTHARWRIDSARLAVALGLYQITEGKTAAKLADLVPKYLPKLPVDPYSGQDFHYRISKGEQVAMGAKEIQVLPGQAILWSTGPDRIDHGGKKHGAQLPMDDARWADGFDLITVIPHWR